jgi:Xaa-Pro aminopeptidase
MRRARLLARLPDVDAQAFLITRLPNVRYLTGFTGSNGQLLLGPDHAVLFTDGRYEDQSASEVPDLARSIYSADFPGAFARACTEGDLSRVAFESDGLTFRAHADLAATGIDLLPTTCEVELLRWVKEPEERANLDAAQAIADAAFAEITGRLREGVSEAEVALDLDTTMRRLGADLLSFDTIVAFGENSAEPHHHPTGRTLRRGEMVKMDFGSLVRGYHSDMTRTVAFGEPPARLREIYEIVRRSQQAGIDALRAGVSGTEVDTASRSVVEDAGLGPAFKHGLGHGVGLEIHEGPSLRNGSTDELPAGTVVTVEPGIYLEGLGGVRIEDMVEVTQDGCRVIPSSTKELIVL